MENGDARTSPGSREGQDTGDRGLRRGAGPVPGGRDRPHGRVGWPATSGLVPLLAAAAALLADAGTAIAQGAPDDRATGARVAEAVRDFDGDGRGDTLALVMVEGRRYRDTTAWCGRGEKYEGEFILRVRMADGRSTVRPLDLDGAGFFRAGDRRIVFDDYDGDGRLDFNLGQYASCVGSSYRLYTVDPSGRVRALLDPGRELMILAFRNSTDRVVPVAGGIEFCRYDRSRGYLRVRYRWDGERGVFVRDDVRRADGCPPEE